MSAIPMTRRWAAIVAAATVLAAAVVITIVATTGGSSSSNTGGPRAVTAEEAGRLATMRLQNFEAVGVGFHATIVTAQGEVTLNGDVDFHTLTGYGEVSGRHARSYTLEWNSGTLLAWPSPGRPTSPPAAPPTTAPRARVLSPSSPGIDGTLALILGLGESRPDDAKQVQQDGARWLRSTTLNGTTVDVMQGPSPQGPGHGSETSLDFWVDRSGYLLRLDAYLAGSTTPTRIDLDRNAYTAIPETPYLASSAS